MQMETAATLTIIENQVISIQDRIHWPSQFAQVSQGHFIDSRDQRHYTSELSRQLHRSEVNHSLWIPTPLR